MEQAIIFDCDGVLIDSEILYQEIMLGALDQIGLTYNRDSYISRFVGAPAHVFVNGVNDDYQQKFNQPIPAHFHTALNARLHTEFEARLVAISGMSDLIPNITAPKAVASSTGLQSLQKRLKQTSLDHHFGGHIYSGEQVENGKPAPDLFLFAAEKLGIAPQNCIVIEDSENGVKAGVAAGMHVIGFLGGKHCDSAHGDKLRAVGAHDIAEDTASLRKIILQ